MENPAIAGFWLSPQQKYVWSLQQNGAAYRSVCLIPFDRELSSGDVSSILDRLVSRHEILRTIYTRQPGMTYSFQVVLDLAPSRLETVDLSELPQADQSAKLNALFEAEKLQSSGPEQAPILVGKILLLGVGRSALLLSIPAMSADQQSLNVLMQQIEQAATGAKLDDDSEPLRYVQFAQWQNDLLSGNDENAAEGLALWKEHASEAPPLAIPNERKQSGGYSPGSLVSGVESEAFRKIEALAATLKTSISEVLLAAWQSLLWRLTGQSQFKVGVVFDGREYEELREAVGLIAKTIPIEAWFDGNFHFREIVEHVRGSISEAAAWQEYYSPGSAFAGEAPVTFEYAQYLDAESPRRVFVANDSCKLKLLAIRYSNTLALEFEFDKARFSYDFIGRLASYFQQLLASAVSEPETQVSRLPILSDAEQHTLLREWNRTATDYPRDKCFHELFEAQVAATPDRLALRFRENALTYQELNERANQMAHFLRASGVGPDSLVGLCVERSAEMMVALLAILKAGSAYVPLNPDNPKPRLSYQLAGVNTLITQQPLVASLPEFSGKTICLDRDAGLWAEQQRENLPRNNSPESLAYVIYTSGSTGVPKGVAVRHRNLVNYSYFITQRLRLSEFPAGLNFGTVSTIGADLGNTCVFPALISGGCLHVVSYDDSTDPQRFARYMVQYPIDVLKIVPSHLQALLQSAEARELLPHKFLILGGETLTPKLVDKIQSLGCDCEVFNHYGPTETTVGSLTLRLADYNWQDAAAVSIPIGRPIANTQIYILDAWMQPVPTGAIGELYIAGDGVAAGYLNQPERTAERFVRSPFSDDPNALMYRTGDLARYLPDGNVEFLGRGDDQIKIRGFRIELGEIESVLIHEPGIKQAVVMARDDMRGDKRLIAYVVSDQMLNGAMERLRARLKEQLPDYMVPSAIVSLGRIPLTPNGKIDRQALPEPEAVETKAYVAPKNPTEEAVLKIWSEVLRRDRISTDDNFFDLGGHSLVATQVVSRIREQFQVDLPIRALFEQPTISGLADRIEKSDRSMAQSHEPSLVRVSREAYRVSRS